MIITEIYFSSLAVSLCMEIINELIYNYFTLCHIKLPRIYLILFQIIHDPAAVLHIVNNVNKNVNFL